MITAKIYAFADEAGQSLDEQISAMQENALDGLEIRGVDGENVSEITVEKAKEIKKRLDDAGLFVWSIGSPIGKINIEHDDFRRHLETFKHSLALADILGAKCFRLFSFYINGNPDDYRNEVIDRLGQFSEIAASHAVTLCHENEKGIFGDTAARCLEIHKALPELKAVFDMANFIQCGQDTLDAWELLKQYVRYIHVKDALADGSVVPAGKGIGNAAYIAKDYLANGGDAFTIEPHLTVFDGLSDLEQGDGKSKVGKYAYKSGRDAFDAACREFRSILGGI